MNVPSSSNASAPHSIKLAEGSLERPSGHVTESVSHCQFCSRQVTSSPLQVYQLAINSISS